MMKFNASTIIPLLLIFFIGFFASAFLAPVYGQWSGGSGGGGWEDDEIDEIVNNSFTSNWGVPIIALAAPGAGIIFLGELCDGPINQAVGPYCRIDKQYRDVLVRIFDKVTFKQGTACGDFKDALSCSQGECPPHYTCLSNSKGCSCQANPSTGSGMYRMPFFKPRNWPGPTTPPGNGPQTPGGKPGQGPGTGGPGQGPTTPGGGGGGSGLCASAPGLSGEQLRRIYDLGYGPNGVTPEELVAANNERCAPLSCPAESNPASDPMCKLKGQCSGSTETITGYDGDPITIYGCKCDWPGCTGEPETPAPVVEDETPQGPTTPPGGGGLCAQATPMTDDEINAANNTSGMTNSEMYAWFNEAVCAPRECPADENPLCPVGGSAGTCEPSRSTSGGHDTYSCKCIYGACTPGPDDVPDDDASTGNTCTDPDFGEGPDGECFVAKADPDDLPGCGLILPGPKKTDDGQTTYYCADDQVKSLGCGTSQFVVSNFLGSVVCSNSSPDPSCTQPSVYSNPLETCVHVGDYSSNDDSPDNGDDGSSTQCVANDGIADPAGQCGCPAENPGAICTYVYGSSFDVACSGNGLPADQCIYQGMYCVSPNVMVGPTCYKGSTNPNDIVCGADELKLLGSGYSWYCINREVAFPGCTYLTKIQDGYYACLDGYEGYPDCQVPIYNGDGSVLCLDPPQCHENGCMIPAPYPGCQYPTITADGQPGCWDESCASTDNICPPPGGSSSNGNESSDEEVSWWENAWENFKNFFQ